MEKSNEFFLKVRALDIETYPEFFLACFYIPEEDKFLLFRINKNVNDLYKFVKYLESLPNDLYIITYNGVQFDGQVITWILAHYEEWFNLSNLEISAKISRFASDIIDDQKYDIQPPYPESYLFHKQIDTFKINHFDNENKRTSLKWCEFMMSSPNVMDMDHEKAFGELTDEIIEEIEGYCKNDTFESYRTYKYTIGECDNPEYAGENAIQNRLDIIQEVGFPCMNWSDVKIGEEWNKRDYLFLSGKKESEIWPKKVRYFFGMKYKDFFPKTVGFQSDEIRNFIKKVGETHITAKKQEFKVKIGENNVCIGRGGIHSSEGPRMISSDKDFQYRQIDIGSQYPNAYRKYGLYPAHLCPKANTMVVNRIASRLEFKALYEKTGESKYNSLAKMGKLALNGGLYGKLKQKGSFLEDHICQLKITMGCQLEILMIVEALVLKGFRVVSLNTDGFDVLIKRDRISEFDELLKFYEKKIGNNELGNFEQTDFDWIVQTSVNGYLAKKTKDGKYKEKKEFKTNYKLNENKSRRIVPLALKAYYGEGKDVEEFIKGHSSIFDFLIGVKETKDYYFALLENGEQKKLQRVGVYYVSRSGNKLLKFKKEGSKATGNDVEEAEAPDQKVWLCKEANKIDETKPIESYDIDYQYYINKTLAIIQSIKKEKKVKPKTLEDPNAITLF